MKKFFLVAVILLTIFFGYGVHAQSGGGGGTPPTPVPLTFVVNSNLDTDDAGINGVCDDGAGHCTLRAAITESNANAGLVDTIHFASGMTITPTSGYSITDKVIIDASSVGSCPVPTVFLNGATSGNYVIQLYTGSAGSIIRGLWINHYTQAGIAISGISGDQTVLTCNVIGLDSDGVTAAGAGDSIVVQNSSDLLIGGSNTSDRNTLSGNQKEAYSEAIGIGGGTVPMAHFIFQGNYFGTDISGQTIVENGVGEGQGIDIYSNSQLSDVSIINNLFAGSAFSIGDADTISVKGNTVDLAADGTTQISATSGTAFDFGSGATNITVGGTGAGEGNVITASGAQTAIGFRGSSHARVVGNFFGVQSDGITPLINGGFSDAPVVINNNSTDITIGGVLPSEKNIILNNELLHSFAGYISVFSSSHVAVQGNQLGINDIGTLFPINVVGIIVGRSNDVTIGGLATGQGNVVAGPAVGVFALANNRGDVVISGNTIRDTSRAGIMNIRTSLIPVADNYATILQNTFTNTHTAIDLAEDLDGNIIPEVKAGPTVNDAGDADSGPNDYLNTPIIHSVDAATGLITYSLDVPAGTYRVEFFRNPAYKQYGQGEVYAGFDTFVSTGVKKQQTVTLQLQGNSIVSANATEDFGSGNYGATSEMSQTYEPLPVVATQTSSSGKGTPWTPVTQPKLVSSSVCPVGQQLMQNLKTGARNGKYNSYTKAVVTEAKILQTHMNRLGFSAGPVDGILGKLTDAAIKRMQKYLGTYQDGMVGPLTRGLINNSCGVNGLQKS